MNQYLINRHGEKVRLSLDKIRDRIEEVSRKINLLPSDIDQFALMQIVISRMADKMKTSDIDTLIARECIGKSIENYAYYKLASAIAISNLQKNVFIKRSGGYAEVLLACIDHVANNGEAYPLINAKWRTFVETHAAAINGALDYSRDFIIDYFGFSTLLNNSYLMRDSSENVIETPADMYMRVAIQCYNSRGIDAVIRAYTLMSSHAYTHATPTILNSMTPMPQLASCFLIDHPEDSIEGMYGGPHTVGAVPKMAMISKSAGGIGIALHNIRSAGQRVKTTNGKTNGLVPYIRVINAEALHVDQGSKRAGAIAIYLTPIHPDFVSVMKMKRHDNDEKDRATSLFYGCWIPDEFMRRVALAYRPDHDDSNPVMWSTFDYNEYPHLYELHSDEFTREYIRLETEGRYKSRYPILEIWQDILRTQRKTSMPYMLYSDACNNKSNQKNLGYIKSSNLCSEIIEYSSPTETAVCNLASISLPYFVKRDPETDIPFFDHQMLHEVAHFITIGLNMVIDETYYPTACAKRSNMKHRPIGLGVQGLVDVYMMMGYAYESEEANKLNILIHETIYHGAMSASVELAKQHGYYDSFPGSPLSEGKFQFDLWDSVNHSNVYNWDILRKEVTIHGARNSLLVALMPTASTSQIMGNFESFETMTMNISRRETSAGNYIIINKHLAKVLQKYNKYNLAVNNSIILNEGSVAHLPFLTAHEKNVFKTAWEIKQKAVINQAADRGRFVDQSQSMNLFLENPDQDTMTSMHLYAWRSGLKTGMYYLRSRSGASENKSIALTSAPSATSAQLDTDAVCTMKDGCISCGS
jgi:ribonucleoside-diphosphate reductase alpha chain